MDRSFQRIVWLMALLVFVLMLGAIWWGLTAFRQDWYEARIRTLVSSNTFDQHVRTATALAQPNNRPQGGYENPARTVLIGGRSIILTHPKYQLLTSVETIWAKLYETLRVLETDKDARVILVPLSQYYQKSFVANEEFFVAVEFDVEELNDNTVALFLNMLFFFPPPVIVLLIIAAWYQSNVTRKIVSLRNYVKDFSEHPYKIEFQHLPKGEKSIIAELYNDLIELRGQLQLSLLENRRLAHLGESVSKVNHDVRNMLASTLLHSEALERSFDSSHPQYNRLTVIQRSINHAVHMCNHILEYVRSEDTIEVLAEEIQLYTVGEDVIAELSAFAYGQTELHNNIEVDAKTFARRKDMHRVFSNLIRNSIESGAKKVTLEHKVESEEHIVDVVDDGPGLPQRAIEKLFVPFQGGVRAGGSGLGLPIAYELSSGMGANLRLLETSENGTRFRLRLPKAEEKLPTA